MATPVPPGPTSTAVAAEPAVSMPSRPNEHNSLLGQIKFTANDDSSENGESEHRGSQHGANQLKGSQHGGSKRHHSEHGGSGHGGSEHGGNKNGGSVYSGSESDGSWHGVPELDRDYSLYLVTDSTKPILGDRNLVDVVEEAIKGGVTIVQYRDKTSDTGVLVSTARALHKVCKRYSVPLLINDRVDVVLAVGCGGVHVGQDDMSVKDARLLLGPEAIIGCTVCSIEETQAAIDQGADYLGIGTVYSTSTKTNTKSILGISGVRKILEYLDVRADELGLHAEDPMRTIKTVVIGGINASNLQLVKHQLYTPSAANPDPKAIDGVALVSAIIAADDPKAAARHLRALWDRPPPFSVEDPTPLPKSAMVLAGEKLDDVEAHTIYYADAVTRLKPISHNMTNMVVQNFAANIALAIGASPIMSMNGAEADDLASLGGGLVINMGTSTPAVLEHYRLAIQAYNAVGGPIVLDPVAAGATTERKKSLAYLMASGYFDVIKGNEAEIIAVARASGLNMSNFSDTGAQEQQRGVDSGPSKFVMENKVELVSWLAKRERNIVLMTGGIDIISDGSRTYAIANGNSVLGSITGAGCALGTVIAAYLGAAKADARAKSGPGTEVREDKLLAAIAGILHYEIAAEDAIKLQSLPGSFVPHFIDSLSVRRGLGWMKLVDFKLRAKVATVHLDVPDWKDQLAKRLGEFGWKKQ